MTNQRLKITPGGVKIIGLLYGFLAYIFTFSKYASQILIHLGVLGLYLCQMLMDHSPRTDEN